MSKMARHESVGFRGLFKGAKNFDLYYLIVNKAIFIKMCSIFLIVVLIMTYEHDILINLWEEVVYTEREGTMGCLLRKSPKICNNVFLFVDLTTLPSIYFYRIILRNMSH